MSRRWLEGTGQEATSRTAAGVVSRVAKRTRLNEARELWRRTHPTNRPGTAVTETVYRHELPPVLLIGAEVME